MYKKEYYQQHKDGINNYQKSWRQRNKERFKELLKKIFQRNKEKRYRSTNLWRSKLTPGQKLTGYSDATLMSFKKSKLIEIIRELEKNV